MFVKHNQYQPVAGSGMVHSPQQMRAQASQHVVQQNKQQPNPRKAIEEYSFGLNDQIGKGFSSKVFKGRNDITGEIVAVKVIEMQLLKTPLHHALLRSEIESLQSLDCENVIKLNKVLQTQNNTYLVTEFCECGDLGSRLTAEQRLSESVVADIMIGVVKGYKALKQQGIVHRDIKPANILMKNGLPKIADFGFATTPHSRLTMPNVNVGSPLYMSPQALRQNKYSEKSDIWAIGATAFELLYGQVPWQAGSEKELGQKMLTVPCCFPNSPQISEDCKNFIRCCLIVDEAKRFTIEELDRHQWLRRRWVQAKAQESAKKALKAPIVQVKQLSQCKPIKSSPLATKTTFQHGPSLDDLGKENSPKGILHEPLVRRQASQVNSQSYVAPFSNNNNLEIRKFAKKQLGKKSTDFQRNSVSLIEKEQPQITLDNDHQTERDHPPLISKVSQSTNCKLQKHVKMNDFVILAQLNFCRYLFRVAQLLDKGSLFSEEVEKHRLLFVIFKHLLIKMKRLKRLVSYSFNLKVEPSSANPLSLIDFDAYQNQDSFKQLAQAINQYEQKYLLQFATYWLTVFQNSQVKKELTECLGDVFSNDFSENLEFELSIEGHLKHAIINTTSRLDEWLASVGQDALVPLEVEPSLVLLDYLVTYMQLVSMFEWNDWSNFAKMSRIEQIASGKPVRLTMAHYVEIKRKVHDIL